MKNYNNIVYENYEELVVILIREKYTVNDELSIIRKREVNQDEFIEYFNYVEDCKVKAKEIISKEV